MGEGLTLDGKTGGGRSDRTLQTWLRRRHGDHRPAITGLIILGIWDLLGGIVTSLRIAWYYRNRDRRPTL